MPNFKKLAKSYVKTGLVALQKFIQIPSVYDEGSIKEGAPYGTNVKKALDYFAKLGKDYGFKVSSADGHAVELEIGDEGPLIGIYGHSDVVPVSGVWTHPEFGGEIKDGVVYGRGACDDKGPLLASLYAVKLLKDNGLIKGFRVKIVSGGDEERGSSCLRYYFEKWHGEEPAYGFTPDANWPLIYAEKGIIHAHARKICDLSPVIAMNGGTVPNAVCDSLLVTLAPDKGFEKYLDEHKINAEVTSSSVLLAVRFIGKTAHGSTPELGVNAATIAFKALGEYYKLEALNELAKAMDDPNGSPFGGDKASPELGKNTFNYGVVSYDGKSLSVSIDFRYGEKGDPEACLDAFAKASKTIPVIDSKADPLLYAKDSTLVSTLMKAYKRETWKFFDKPLAIGGGTYAKEAKNTVAFGAEWPNHPGNMHSPDEYIYVQDFERDIAIYARAILALGNAAKKGK